jgi:hypothetical protein
MSVSVKGQTKASRLNRLCSQRRTRNFRPDTITHVWSAKSPPPRTLVFLEKAPIIVVMNIGFGTGANKDGQQPSHLYLPANLKKRSLRMQTITEVGPFSDQLNRQIAASEPPLSYRKQRPTIGPNRQNAEIQIPISIRQRSFFPGPRKGFTKQNPSLSQSRLIGRRSAQAAEDV